MTSARIVSELRIGVRVGMQLVLIVPFMELDGELKKKGVCEKEEKHAFLV